MPVRDCCRKVTLREKLTDKLQAVRTASRDRLALSRSVTLDRNALIRMAGMIPAWSKKASLSPIALNATLSSAEKVGLTLLFSAVNYCYVDPKTGEDYSYIIDGQRYARSSGFLTALMASGLPWGDFAEMARVPRQQWRQILHADDAGVVLFDVDERTARLGAFAGYLATHVGMADAFFDRYPNAQAVYELLINSGMFDDEYLKRLQVALVWLSDAATSAGLHFDVSERAYTAMADYRLPQVLMNEGVITITAAAQGKLGRQLLDMELEGDIRAATIVACEELARQSGYPEVAVDRALWHASQVIIATGGMRVPAMRVATRKY